MREDSQFEIGMGSASDSLPHLFRQHGDNKTRPNLRTENDVGTTSLRRIESPHAESKAHNVRKRLIARQGW